MPSSSSANTYPTPEVKDGSDMNKKARATIRLKNDLLFFIFFSLVSPHKTRAASGA
jgi:hypothetical protein